MRLWIFIIFCLFTGTNAQLLMYFINALQDLVKNPQPNTTKVEPPMINGKTALDGNFLMSEALKADAKINKQTKPPKQADTDPPSPDTTEAVTTAKIEPSVEPEHVTETTQSDMSTHSPVVGNLDSGNLPFRIVAVDKDKIPSEPVGPLPPGVLPPGYGTHAEPPSAPRAEFVPPEGPEVMPPSAKAPGSDVEFANLIDPSIRASGKSDAEVTADEPHDRLKLPETPGTSVSMLGHDGSQSEQGSSQTQTPEPTIEPQGIRIHLQSPSRKSGSKSGRPRLQRPKEKPLEPIVNPEMRSELTPEQQYYLQQINRYQERPISVSGSVEGGGQSPEGHFTGNDTQGPILDPNAGGMPPESAYTSPENQTGGAVGDDQLSQMGQQVDPLMGRGKSSRRMGQAVPMPPKPEDWAPKPESEIRQPLPPSSNPQSPGISMQAPGSVPQGPGPSDIGNPQDPNAPRNLEPLPISPQDNISNSSPNLSNSTGISDLQGGPPDGSVAQQAPGSLNTGPSQESFLMPDNGQSLAVPSIGGSGSDSGSPQQPQLNANETQTGTVDNPLTPQQASGVENLGPQLQPQPGAGAPNATPRKRLKKRRRRPKVPMPPDTKIQGYLQDVPHVQYAQPPVEAT